MEQALRMTRWAALIVAAALCTGAMAQQGPAPMKSICQGIGTAPPEPVGDREGHTFTVGHYSCQTQGGPFDGAISTGMTIWESDKGKSVALSGNGTIRRPGLSIVYVLTEASNALTMADGKVTGFSGNARGVYKIASGSAAALAGKTFTSTFRSVAGGQFVIETTVD